MESLRATLRFYRRTAAPRGRFRSAERRRPMRGAARAILPGPSF
ncbi:hypothetical protein HMPREF9440_00337, partial [Sutterella parvirubra YIT 11816]